ncbi:MAG TPA: glutathione S-transferase family protein [Solirubrobacteraceae bacterium]|nr:glutathione S-transferase family protein [Solirubrobacteraceae bacterium]
MLRLYRFPYSTNVDRVALALAHKGLAVESVWIDPADRSPVEEVSGQPLVPVLVDGDVVIADSTAIVEHLEATHPDPPLYPADPARSAEARVFGDWFNRVWKRPPNLLAEAPDAPEAPEWRAELRASLDVFEALLSGRDHLLGGFGVADVVAWPFLRYATATLEPDDVDPFHHVLAEHLATTAEHHPKLVAWIDRVATRPMA